MYTYRKEKPAMSRKMRDILILVLAASLVLNIVFAVLLFSGSTSDTRLSDTLISMTQSNVVNVRTAATQLSRTGGSYTTQLLGESRQYLYGMEQTNYLAQTLLGHELLPTQTVSAALEAVADCENRMLTGQALDEQLADLWEQINILQECAAKLGGV